MTRLERRRRRSAGLGLRMTPQRAALLQALGRFSHHPTADELYRHVKKALPSVSPATVYRNVQKLVEAGLLATLERGSGPVRYDANLDDHHHFVCTRCGRITDIYLNDVRYAVNKRRSGLQGARIEGCDVQLRGCCARCR